MGAGKSKQETINVIKVDVEKRFDNEMKVVKIKEALAKFEWADKVDSDEEYRDAEGKMELL